MFVVALEEQLKQTEDNLLRKCEYVQLYYNIYLFIYFKAQTNKSIFPGENMRKSKINGKTCCSPEQNHKVI